MMIEQPWDDERLKMNGVFIGCVTTNNANEIIALQRDAERYRCLRDKTSGEEGSPSCWRDTGYGEGFPRLEGVALDAEIDEYMLKLSNAVGKPTQPKR